MVDFPNRLRIWGAEDICAARPQEHGALVTACSVLAVTPDERRGDDEAATCPRCRTAIQNERN